MMKNKIYEKDETFSDPNTDMSSDNDNSSEIELEDYEETDDDYPDYDDE